jgi:Lrp/AsnC family transcriptional regulator for asnA, asnC and gidA
MLDAVDLGIVKVLRREPRASARHIAIELGLDEGAVRARLKQLIDSQVVRVTVVNDVAKRRNPTLAIIWVDLERGANTSLVVEKICALREVIFVSAVVGVADLLVMSFVKNNESLTEFVHGSLDSISGVADLHYDICVSVAKDDFLFLPL